MTFIGGIFNFFNSFKLKLWPSNRNLKRPHSRDSLDDEEEDIFASCQTLSKKPRWMSSPYPANMAFDGFRSNQNPNQSHTQRARSKKPKQPLNLNTEVKENKTENEEVIVLDSDDCVPLEARPPLSNLSVRSKSKPEAASTSPTACSGVIRRPSHERLMMQRRGNSSFSNSFTSSHLKPSRSSSSHRTTTLNESYSVEDRNTYSRLLEEYHRSVASLSSSREDSQQQRSKQFPIVRSLSMRSCHSTRNTEFIDLTRDETEKRQNLVSVNVKPYQTSKAEEEVKILEEWPVTRVNSLEKALSANSLVDPNWIIEISKKYNERQREMEKELEKERLKKEFYLKHNQAKLTEELDERIRRHLRLTEVVLDETEDVTALPDLTPQMLEKVNQCLKPNPPNEVLVSAFGLQIKRVDIQTLKGLNWLNDEVINFYMNLIIERGKQEKYTKVYAFNTFFYPKLVSKGYSTLRRWTKKVDIFAHELLLVPIHLGVHWCMAIIDFRDKTIKYYDSMGSSNNRCLQALRQYLVEERMDKKQETYDVSGWTTENVQGIPQQMNGSDCGMFSCMFAEYVSRNAKITFSQRDMPYFRQKMVYEIVTKQLLL